jgi:hypothetical protein
MARHVLQVARVQRIESRVNELTVAAPATPGLSQARRPHRILQGFRSVRRRKEGGSVSIHERSDGRHSEAARSSYHCAAE